jgi:hypothetical protein
MVEYNKQISFGKEYMNIFFNQLNDYYNFLINGRKKMFIFFKILYSEKEYVFLDFQGKLNSKKISLITSLEQFEKDFFLKFSYTKNIFQYSKTNFIEEKNSPFFQYNKNQIIFGELLNQFPVNIDQKKKLFFYMKNKFKSPF